MISRAASVVGVEVVHDAAGVDVAAQVVEGPQQGLAIAEPVARHAGRAAHVGQGLVVAVVLGGAKRRMAAAEIIGMFPGRVVVQADVGGHAVAAAPQPADDGADGGALLIVDVERFAFFIGEAAEEFVAGVVADRVHAAQNGQLVGHARLHRHQVAKFDAGHIGADRLKFAAKLGRGVRLHVIGVDVRRAAAEENHDGGLAAGLRIDRPVRLEPNQIGQGEAAQAECADAQEIAPRRSAAKWMAIAQEVQHAKPPKSEDGILAVLPVISEKRHGSNYPGRQITWASAADTGSGVPGAIGGSLRNFSSNALTIFFPSARTPSHWSRPTLAVADRRARLCKRGRSLPRRTGVSKRYSCQT